MGPMERKIRDVEATLKGIFENELQAFILVGKDCKISSFNKLAGTVVKIACDQEMKIGESIFNYTFTSAPNVFKENLNRAFCGETIHIEEHGSLVDGEEYYYDFYFYPVFDDLGDVIAVCLSAFNITWVKQTEIQLKDSEDRFNRFMQNSPAISFIKDAAGRYIYVNSAFKRALNLENSEWRWKTAFQLLNFPFLILQTGATLEELA